MHSIESRFVIRSSNIPFAGVYVCTFQPGNFTGCDSKGVKLGVSENITLQNVAWIEPQSKTSSIASDESVTRRRTAPPSRVSAVSLNRTVGDHRRDEVSYPSAMGKVHCGISILPPGGSSQNDCLTETERSSSVECPTMPRPVLTVRAVEMDPTSLPTV